MSETNDTGKTNGRTHTYHAEAHVLEGGLQLPLTQEIKPQAYVKLPEQGGYYPQRVENYKLEEIISFRTAYTQVAGNLVPKKDHGHSTLATSVIEGLNVLEVVTADRIVGQVITEHPLVGNVPHISFLGTRFENLRIAGCLVDVKLNLDILGARSESDLPYTQDPALKSRIASQFGRLGEHQSLLAEMREGFHQLFPATAIGEQKREPLELSLVSEVTGVYPGRGLGHVIRIPGFGTIVLARVALTHQEIKKDGIILKATTVRLTMIDFKLGCPVTGDFTAATTINNGMPVPPP
jgi:hypothetical protein